MTDCYLAMTRGASAVSNVIREADKGPASHVAFIYWSRDFEGWWVVHSDFPKIAAIPLSEFLQRGNIVVELWSFPAVSLWTALQRCVKEDAGKRYDYGGLWGQAIIKVWRFFGRKDFKNVHDDPALWFCSEWAVGRVLPAAGVKLLDKATAPSAISPEDLRGLLKPCALAHWHDPDELKESRKAWG